MAPLVSLRVPRMGGKINDRLVTSRPCVSFPQLCFHGGTRNGSESEASSVLLFHLSIPDPTAATPKRATE